MKLDPMPKNQIKKIFYITKIRVRYYHFILIQKFVEEDPPLVTKNWWATMQVGKIDPIPLLCKKASCTPPNYHKNSATPTFKGNWYRVVHGVSL